MWSLKKFKYISEKQSKGDMPADLRGLWEKNDTHLYAI